LGHFVNENWVQGLEMVALGYVLGSIPFGLLLTRLAGGGDIRAIGSGNIGATNVLRSGNKVMAALTLILDMLKGTVAVLIAARYFPNFAVLAAMGAFLGHLYPVWLKFQGGKGVATMMGVLLGLIPWAALVYAVVWLGSLAITRISSLSGMLAGLSVPISLIVMGKMAWVPLFAGLTLLMLWKHRSNIERLLAGEEPKVGRS
jgi:glycerol-3-phosphate acyltransferase PlsY